MSRLLYRIGKSAYDKPWRFIATWVLILGIAMTGLGINGVNLSTEMKLEGTESQKLLDKLEQVLPLASGGQANVVFKAPKGERLDSSNYLPPILEAVNGVYAFEHVINPADLMDAAGASGIDPAMLAEALGGGEASGEAGAVPTELPPYGTLIVDGYPVPGLLISSDGSVLLFQFQFTVQQASLPPDVAEAIFEAVTAVESDTGIQVWASEALQPFEIPVGPQEIVGLAIAAIVLIVTLGSVVSAGLPLVVALFGVGIGVGGAFAISKFLAMTSATPVLALMIGLAVGIDYALFIVNRQRRLILDQGLTAREAASRSVGTAGSAVFFAGLTVIISLCGLLVINISFLSVMALVASATVLLTVLIALTLLPALLGLMGERICSAKAREKNRVTSSSRSEGFATKWANAIVKLRWPVIISVIIVLGVAAIPAAKMELGIPSGGSANLDTSIRQSYDAISEAFGEGFNGPLLIVAEPHDTSASITPQVLFGLMQELQTVENVSVVTPLGVNDTGDMAILSIIPKTGPTDETTRHLVEELRSADSPIAQAYNMNIGVTGFTAVNIDMSAKLGDVFPIYIGIIVVLSLIILLLVFRSIIVPIKATVGFLLSVLATFGLTTAVFQWGWFNELFGFDTAGPLLSFIPIIATGILYGLAMDYQVFLVSSMRESYVHGNRDKNSVIHGYGMASRVVVAAAIIMVSVFAGFIFAHDIMIKQIGFALAIGILIDAFVIRMMLVPAVMALFGDKAWWLPNWLDRLLPNLDVEGDKLIAELEGKDGAHVVRQAH